MVTRLPQTLSLTLTVYMYGMTVVYNRIGICVISLNFRLIKHDRTCATFVVSKCIYM